MLYTVFPFARVDYPTDEFRAAEGWVLANSLVTDGEEIATAALVNKACALKTRQDEHVGELVDRLYRDHRGSRLLGLLEEDPTLDDHDDQGEDSYDHPERRLEAASYEEKEDPPELDFRYIFTGTWSDDVGFYYSFEPDGRCFYSAEGAARARATTMPLAAPSP